MARDFLTYCDECKHLDPVSGRGSTWGWLCLKHKNFMDHPLSQTHRTTAPYLRCKDVNAGACPLFERKNDGIRNEE